MDGLPSARKTQLFEIEETPPAELAAVLSPCTVHADGA